MKGWPGRMRTSLAGVVVGLVALAGCASGGPARSGTDASAGAGGHLYVPNQDDATVSVVDVDTHEVVRTVDLTELGFPPDANPHDVVAEGDGSHWYVSLIGADAVLKFDANDELVGRAELETPGMLALHPTEDVLYVGRSMKAVNPPQRIGRIETSDMSIEEIEVLFPRPHAIAIGPEGERLHTASLAVNRIATLDVGTERVTITEVEGPTHVFVQFNVSPDGDRLVATGQASGRLLAFDRTSTDELRRVASVEVGAQPWHPVFTPDGRYVLFGNKEEDTVMLVDAGSWEVAAVIEGEGLSQPHGAAVSPDGRYAFVSNNNLDGAWEPEGWTGGDEGEGGGSPPGSVVVVDLESRSVVDVIEVGHNPTGLGLRPKR